MRKSILILRVTMVISYFVALGFVGKYELDLISFTTLCKGTIINTAIMVASDIAINIIKEVGYIETNLWVIIW